MNIEELKRNSSWSAAEQDEVMSALESYKALARDAVDQVVCYYDLIPIAPGVESTLLMVPLINLRTRLEELESSLS